MSEERRICAAKPIKPISRPLGLATQPLELTARPAAVEGLNDDHAAAATGAFVCLSIVRRGFDRGCSCRQQLACVCDVLSTTGAGKEPVMADAMEPFGQDMKKETADEFVGRQRHGLVAAW